MASKSHSSPYITLKSPESGTGKDSGLPYCKVLAMTRDKSAMRELFLMGKREGDEAISQFQSDCWNTGTELLVQGRLSPDGVVWINHWIVQIPDKKFNGTSGQVLDLTPLPESFELVEGVGVRCVTRFANAPHRATFTIENVDKFTILPDGRICRLVDYFIEVLGEGEAKTESLLYKSLKSPKPMFSEYMRDQIKRYESWRIGLEMEALGESSDLQGDL